MNRRYFHFLVFLGVSVIVTLNSPSLWAQTLTETAESAPQENLSAQKDLPQDSAESQEGQESQQPQDSDPATAGKNDSTPQQASENGLISSETPENRFPYFNPPKVAVDPNTGSTSMSVPIQVPQGRGGIQPNIAISYNSNMRNGPLGVGWNLELGAITRSLKKGVPLYTDEDTFTLIQSGSTQDLVYDTSAEFYRAKIEGAFMKIEKKADHWLVTDKKGTKYFFGRTADSRQARGYGQDNVFKWCLDRVEDVFGNFMEIHYRTYADEEYSQIYPDYIVYTDHDSLGGSFARVEFGWRTRDDIRTSYRFGFPVMTIHLLDKIYISANGEEQSRYELNYQESTTTRVSLLTSITQKGADGTALPTISFTYQEKVSNAFENFSFDIPFEFTDKDGKDTGARFGDLNGDGLVDVLIAKDGMLAPETYINDGTRFQRTPNWRVPVENGMWFIVQDYRDTGVRLVDLNGDGLIDLIKANDGTEKAYLNDGQGFVDVTGGAWNVPDDMWFIVNDKDNAVRLADVNGDGLVDLVRSIDGANQNRTYLNTGSGFQPCLDKWVIPDVKELWFIYGGMDNGVRLADINGDGLADLVAGEYDRASKTYLNTGRTFEYTTSWAVPQKMSFTRGGSDYGGRLADVNGDGLVDLVSGEYDRGSQTYLNNGRSFDLYATTNWAIPHEMAFTKGGKDTGVRLIDADGDGLVDLLSAKGEQDNKAMTNNGIGFDLLSEVRNGVGATTKMTYQPAIKHERNERLPFPFYIVQETETLYGAERYRTQYDLRNAYWAPYPHQEFRGFGEVKIIDGAGNYTKTIFETQNDYQKGRPKVQESYDASGKLLTKTLNKWANRAIVADQSYFVYPLEDEKFLYEGNQTYKKHTVTTYEDTSYDEHGNLLWVKNHGEWEPPYGDERSVETDYWNNTADWLLGLPKEIRIKDAAGQVVRQNWFYYDTPEGEPQDFNRMPTKGLLTQKEDWHTGGRENPNNPKTQYTYDAYGNLETTTDPLGHTTTIEYDGRYKLFPVKTTNALSQEVKNIYYGVNADIRDPSDPYYDFYYGQGSGLWGQLKSTIDPNSQVSLSIYDTFGRKTTVVSPLDNIQYPTSQSEYTFFSDYIRVKTSSRVEHKKPQTLEGISFYDGLGRLIESKSLSETQYIVSGMTEYNNRGLPVKKYLPFYSTEAWETIVSVPAANTPFTTFAYDAQGRVTETWNPYKDPDKKTYTSIGYDGWTTTTIDENGRQQTSEFDAYGRLIKHVEYQGADGRNPNLPYNAPREYAVTSYVYDSEGNLTRVISDDDFTDHTGKKITTTIEYDKLGRKIEMDDPDMGKWTYEYDLNGNLKAQTDAKEQRIEFTYDELNRLKNKKDSLGGPLNVDYLYDDPNVYAVGRLRQVIYGDPDNTQFAYDRLGREIQSTKAIDGIGYKVERGYDALNRLKEVIYPDTAEVKYTYNAAGQIERMIGTEAVVYPDEVKLLITADEKEDGSQDFEDETDRHQVRAIGAQIDTQYTAVGDGAALFYPADGGDYLKLDDSEDWHFGAESWAVDFYARFNSLPSSDDVPYTFIGPECGCDVDWKISLVKEADKYYLVVYRAKDNFVEWNTVKNEWIPPRLGDTFYHIVVDYKSDTETLTVLVDGVELPVKGGALEIHDSSYGRLIGSYGGGEFFDGSIDQLTIKKYGPQGQGQDDEEVVYVTNVDYNKYGQMVLVEYGNGVKTTYEYDPATLRLTTLTTTSTTTTLQNLSYTYDYVGNILTIVDNSGRGSNQTFTYDALNRLETAAGKYFDDGNTSGTKRYVYDEVGNIDYIVETVNAVETIEDYSYGGCWDEGDQTLCSGPHAVTSITKDGDAWLNFKYDKNGNMSEQTDHEKNETTVYTYDTENRLVQVTRDAVPVAQYEYDGDGGRVKKIVFKEKDLQAQGAGVKFGFDKWLIEKESRSFSNPNSDGPNGAGIPTPWKGRDSAQQTGLSPMGSIGDTEITPPEAGESWKPGSPTRGIEEKLNGEVTKYVGSLYEVQGTRQIRYIFLGNQKIASVDSKGKTSYFTTDHLGSTNLILDDTGSLKEWLEYEPFGAMTTHEMYGGDEDEANFYFSGKEFDSESGLIYFGARYYDPSLGRFITPDTIVPYANDPQSFSRYTYARNNPVVLVDPDGHFFWFFAAAAVAGAVWGTTTDSGEKFFQDWGGMFGFYGGLINGINGNWNLLQSQAISFGTGFLFGGPVGGMSAMMTTSILDTKAGRKATEWTANEIFDDMFGVNDPQLAYILGYTTLSIAGNYAFERAYANMTAEPGTIEKFDPNNPDHIEAFNKQRSGYNSYAKEISTNPDKSWASAEGNQLWVITKKNGDVAVFGELPYGPAVHAGANATSFPSALNNSAPSIMPKGVFGFCHQAANASLLKAGFSNVATQMSNNFSTYVSTFVYGNYGGGLMIKANSVREAYNNRE